MARTMFRDVGGGRRRGDIGFVTPVLSLLLISMMAGCGLDSPTSPNTPGELTGQTTNQEFSFSGSVSVESMSATLPADDIQTVTVRANVKNAAGNPIPNLTTVTFRTDLGGFLVGVDPSTGASLSVDTLTATTFNGQAEVEFVSSDRETGTANITASIGDVTGSATVELEHAVIKGSLSLGFGSGIGPITQTGGFASQNAPLDVTVGVLALDLAGDPIPGAKVRFNIVQDTTDEGSPNDPAHWVTASSTVTGSLGDAVNILRVYGSGVIALDAVLIDPVTGDSIAVSNRIILTTQAVKIVKLTFADGSTSFTKGAPFNVGLRASVFDGTNSVQPGLQVRFSIISDSTTGATLSSTIGTTDANGETTSSVRLPDPGVVTIKAGLYDAQNKEIASATVTAIGS